MQNILDAKLLRFKEDVEDIALSSVKEADIENKKNAIAADWEDRELAFGEFKHRGPIVLKGEDTNITKELLEESQLQIGSMLASRFVAPFREVCHRLRSTSLGALNPPPTHKNRAKNKNHLAVSGACQRYEPPWTLTSNSGQRQGTSQEHATPKNKNPH